MPFSSNQSVNSPPAVGTGPTQPSVHHAGVQSTQPEGCAELWSFRSLGVLGRPKSIITHRAIAVERFNTAKKHESNNHGLSRKSIPRTERSSRVSQT